LVIAYYQKVIELRSHKGFPRVTEEGIKREEFPWMLEVTKCAPQMAIIHLGDAFKRFFAGVAKYPQFKKKGQHDSFTITNDQFRVEGSRIRIPNLGWVRMRESLRITPLSPMDFHLDRMR
jgi:transposase